MNHSQRMAASLVTLANDLHANTVKPTNDSYVGRLKQLRAVDLESDRPFEAALTATAELFLAVEDARKALDHAETALRDKIADAFADSGCPGIYTTGHHVVAVEGQRAVIITDADTVAQHRPDLMTSPKPAPDRRAIASALRRREPVRGAELSNDTSAPGVRFTPLKKA